MGVAPAKSHKGEIEESKMHKQTSRVGAPKDLVLLV
jgi:hypothetical protein